MRRHDGISALAALALLAAMSGGSLPKKDTTRRYPSPIGPPLPMSRQMRRAMERQAKKGIKS